MRQRQPTLVWVSFVLLYGAFYILTPFDLISTVSERRVDAPDLTKLLDVVEGGTLARRVVVFAFGLVGALVLARSGARRLRVSGPLAFAIVAFLALALLSPLWAQDPALTMRRVVVLLMTALATLAAAVAWSGRDLLAFAISSGLASMVIGLGSELALGTLRPFDPGYRFSGIMHANSMGAHVAVVLTAGAAWWRTAAKTRWMPFALIAVAAPLLLMTGSRGATVGGLTATLFCLALPRRRGSGLGTAAAAAALVLGSVVLLVLATFGTDLGALTESLLARGPRDVEVRTLTGRTELWNQLVGYWAQRPLLGYGYDSFWTPTHIKEVSSEQGWVVGAGHSAYVEALVTLGLVGCVLFTSILVLGILRAIVLWRKDSSPASLFFVGLLLGISINMTVEVLLLETTIPSFLAMVVLGRLAFVAEPGREAGSRASG